MRSKQKDGDIFGGTDSESEAPRLRQQEASAAPAAADQQRAAAVAAVTGCRTASHTISMAQSPHGAILRSLALPGELLADALSLCARALHVRLMLGRATGGRPSTGRNMYLASLRVSGWRVSSGSFSRTRHNAPPVIPSPTACVQQLPRFVAQPPEAWSYRGSPRSQRAGILPRRLS